MTHGQRIVSSNDIWSATLMNILAVRCQLRRNLTRSNQYIKVCAASSFWTYVVSKGNHMGSFGSLTDFFPVLQVWGWRVCVSCFVCSEPDGKSRQSNGIPPLILWVSIGCVTGITLLAVLVVTGILCKRKADSERRKRSYVNVVC